jgi:hypothetical protein
MQRQPRDPLRTVHQRRPWQARHQASGSQSLGGPPGLSASVGDVIVSVLPSARAAVAREAGMR